MDGNAKMEQLSLAYVRAVSADAGYQVSIPELDDDSVDGILISRHRKRPRIDFQAKATTQSILRNGHIHFPLGIKNYNDLRADTLTPRILVVLLMPRDQTEWLSQTNEQLCLRRCAYWMSLEGLAEVPNRSTVNVCIPTANVFCSRQLTDLMSKVENGESLC